MGIGRNPDCGLGEHLSAVPARHRAPAIRGLDLAVNRTAATPLKLELTETAIIADPDRARSIISRLHTLGVGLSMTTSDRLHVVVVPTRPAGAGDQDRPFLRHEHVDTSEGRDHRPHRRELAHRLGLASVAEGIEDAETYVALAALGCTTAQGFHLGRPMPGHVFDNWLSDWNIAQEIAGQAALAEPTLAPEVDRPA